MGRKGTEFEVIRVYTPVQKCMTKALEYVRDCPIKQSENSKNLRESNLKEAN